jgi:hypothetical protein
MQDIASSGSAPARCDLSDRSVRKGVQLLNRELCNAQDDAAVAHERLHAMAAELADTQAERDRAMKVCAAACCWCSIALCLSTHMLP